MLEVVGQLGDEGLGTAALDLPAMMVGAVNAAQAGRAHRRQVELEKERKK